MAQPVCKQWMFSSTIARSRSTSFGPPKTILCIGVCTHVTKNRHTSVNELVNNVSTCTYMALYAAKNRHKLQLE